jgi:hypothetical protein
MQRIHEMEPLRAAWEDWESTTQVRTKLAFNTDVKLNYDRSS